MRNDDNKWPKPERYSLFIFICFLIVYLLPGIYGHTPWKQDENYSFGIIQTMYESGHWLVPTNAGEPFMEKPPLYYWTATIMAHLLSGMMPLYDAARSASLLFSIINFSFFMLLARRYFRSSSLADVRIWVALSLYASAPGILRHTHDMFTDTALMAGACVGLYGLLGLIRQEKTVMSAIWLCAGTVITFLSKGVFVPGVLWICLLLAPVFLPSCQRKSYWMQALGAGLLTLPFILPWPVVLYLKHPDLFIVWFWENNIGRFFGFSVKKLGAKAEPMLIPQAVILFALPIGLLFTGYFFRRPMKRLHSENDYLLTLFPALGVVLLMLSASERALYLLPFIAPMAILSTRVVLAAHEKVLARFAAFASGFGGLALLLLWITYFLALSDATRLWLSPLNPLLPMDYRMHFSLPVFSCAVLLTGVWLARKQWIPAHPALRASGNWLAGLMACWGVVFTLFVGWADYAKGYQQVFTDLRQHLNGQYLTTDCMASYRVGESEAPMLYYFAGILHQHQKAFVRPSHCRWLIMLTKTATIRPAPEGMSLFWAGSRPGEFRHRLVVYKALQQ